MNEHGRFAGACAVALIAGTWMMGGCGLSQPLKRQPTTHQPISQKSEYRVPTRSGATGTTTARSRPATGSKR